MKILIVEDDITSRLYVKAILSKVGDCDIGVNGEEAVWMFEKSLEEGALYDLICMDIMMPGIDGIEATSKIRAMEKEKGIAARDEVKIVMMTALDDPKSVISSLYKSGATSYITKPLSKQKVMNMIEELF